MRVLRIFGATLFALTFSLALGSIAVSVGVLNPYPTAPLAAAENGAFGRSGSPLFEDIYRRVGEPLDPYLQRLNVSVNARIIHWWPTEQKRAVGVHPLHNFPLWLKSHVSGYEHFANYEFVSPREAWNRGFGFCSQISRIVYSVLRDQGIQASVIQHPNHVVVEVEGRLIIDADYGVVIHQSARSLKSDPTAVAEAYASFPDALPLLHSIYSEGWIEAATDEQFDAARAHEKSASNWKWILIVIILWVSLTIWDAGRSLSRDKAQDRRS